MGGKSEAGAAAAQGGRSQSARAAGAILVYMLSNWSFLISIPLRPRHAVDSAPQSGAAAAQGGRGQQAQAAGTSSAQHGSLRHEGVSSRAAVPVSMCTAAALGCAGIRAGFTVLALPMIINVSIIIY